MKNPMVNLRSEAHVWNEKTKVPLTAFYHSLKPYLELTNLIHPLYQSLVLIFHKTPEIDIKLPIKRRQLKMLMITLKICRDQIKNRLPYSAIYFTQFNLRGNTPPQKKTVQMPDAKKYKMKITMKNPQHRSHSGVKLFLKH